MEKGEDSEDLVEVRRREVLARWRSGEASEVEGRRWRGDGGEEASGSVV